MIFGCHSSLEDVGHLLALLSQLTTTRSFIKKHQLMQKRINSFVFLFIMKNSCIDMHVELLSGLKLQVLLGSSFLQMRCKVSFLRNVQWNLAEKGHSHA